MLMRCGGGIVCRQVCFTAMRQLCGMHAQQGDPQRAADTLTGLLPALQELDPPAQAMQSLWLGLLAAVTGPGAPCRKAFDEVSNLMHAWELMGDPQERSAELVGQLMALRAAQAARAGDKVQVRL